MRLLFVTYRFPAFTHAADTNTVYHLVKYFGPRHEVSLVALAADHGPSQSRHLVAPYCVRMEAVVRPRWRSALSCARGLLGRRPLQLWYYHSPEIKRRISQVLQEQRIQAAYGYHLRSAPWLADFNDIPRVIAIQPAQVLHYGRRAQIVRQPLKRLLYTMEHRRLQGYERAWARKFDRCLLISEKDRRAIDPQGELDNVFHNPHGTDVEALAPPPGNQREPDSLIFAGALNMDTNRDAVRYLVERLLPLIWRQRPGVKLYIVGKNPPARIKGYARDRRLMVTGFVKDLRPFLWRAAVGVNPMRIAAGMQNKVIEGMAAGLPMVMSQEANEGIGAVDGETVLIAGTPEDFARKVVGLLKNPEQARRLAAAGQALVRTQWSWEHHFQQLEDLLEELVRQRRGHRQKPV
jgi:glycosyltransferase involved in cell wall biosynthesis